MSAMRTLRSELDNATSATESVQAQMTQMRQEHQQHETQVRQHQEHLLTQIRDLREEKAQLQMELHQAQTQIEQAQCMTNGTLHALIAVSGAGHIKSWNVEAERMFGFAEQVRDANVGQSIGYPELDTYLKSHPAQALEQSGWLKTSDGEKYVSIRLSPSGDNAEDFVLAISHSPGQQEQAEQKKMLEHQVHQLTHTVARYQNRETEWQQKFTQQQTVLHTQSAQIGNLKKELEDIVYELNCTRQDLDSRKHLQEEVLKSFDGLLTGTIVIRDHHIAWLNQNAKELLGVNDDAIGEPIENYLPSFTEEDLLDLICAKPDAERMVCELHETMLYRKNRDTYAVLVDAVPTDVHTFRDVTAPENPDILLILRDAIPRQQRQALERYHSPSWRRPLLLTSKNGRTNVQRIAPEHADPDSELFPISQPTGADSQNGSAPHKHYQPPHFGSTPHRAIKEKGIAEDQY